MILKGILDGISDGIKSVLCFTDRAYIKINGRRIKRITTSDIIDNIFQENIGKEIEMSISYSPFFGNIIYAVKEENGEITKTGILNLLLTGFLRGFLWLILYSICYVIFAAVFMGHVRGYVLHFPAIGYIYPVIAFVRDYIYRNKLK